MTLRPYCPDDSPALARLFFQTIRTVNLQDYTQAQVEAWAPEDMDEAQWKRSFEGRFVLVAEVQGEIAGFGELERDGHLDRFYVARDHIGTGVGRTLYEALEARAREWKLPRLYVEASITARPFFERMGFLLVRKQTVHVRGVGLDNFVMEKHLQR